ncbi:MAG: hypothetical protein ACI9YB_003058 [Halioglobus sp.]|jgi:hypothetical protein
MMLDAEDRAHFEVLLVDLKEAKVSATDSMEKLQEKAKDLDDKSPELVFYMHLYKQMVQTVKNIGMTVNELSIMIKV